MSTTAGFHVPVIPFVEVPGKPGTAVPAHWVEVVPKLNVGVIFGLIVTVKVVVVAQRPASGVNV